MRLLPYPTSPGWTGLVPSTRRRSSPPQQARDAYEDQCAPANPRMPMLDDMQELMRAAYYG